MRVVMCDHHRVFADTLSIVLKNNGYQVVACRSTPDDGVTAVRVHEPHLYITELEFPGGDAAHAIASARSISPATRVAVLSGSKDPAAGSRAKRAGASAFLSKRRPLADVLDKIHGVASGVESLFDVPTTGDGFAGTPGATAGDALRFLTVREREVLERLVQGQDTATLAQEMGVTYSTARTHIQNLLCKLGVHSKLEAVAMAINLLSPQPPRPERSPLSRAV